MRKDWFDFVLLIGAFLVAFLTDVSVIYIILVTIVLCIILMVVKNAYAKKKGKITAENTVETAQNDESATDENSIEDEVVAEENPAEDETATQDNVTEIVTDQTAEKEGDR